MLKKFVLFVPLLFCLSHLNAQEEHNAKLAIEAGFLLLSEDSENLGLFLNVEPKIEILENTFLGLRIGLTINSHTFENTNPAEFFIEERFDNAILGFVPTIDYYFKYRINN